MNWFYFWMFWVFGAGLWAALYAWYRFTLWFELIAPNALIFTLVTFVLPFGLLNAVIIGLNA